MAEAKTLTLEELEKILDEFDFERYYAAKRLRKSRPWVRDMIAVLYPRTKGIHIDQLVRELWAMREKALPMPKSFRETVQSRLNHYTSQSAVFWAKGGAQEDDLFYSPEGKGSGTWAVHQERAIAWLTRKKLPAT